MNQYDTSKKKEDSNIILSGKMNEILEILQNVKNQYEQTSIRYNDSNWHLSRINASPWWRLGLWLTDIARKFGIPERYLDITLDKPILYEPLLEKIQTLIDNYKIDAFDNLDLEFPEPDEKPLVSILIPGYGNVHHTIKCLTSIYIHYPKSSIEIIVSDDASNDPELIFIKKIKNIKFFEMKRNIGWLKHVNYLSAYAKGKYIYLLNNDTQIHHHTIDSLVDVAENFKNIGAVGSKLIYPDGKLQEAGGIIWENGKAWNYGKFDNPDKPEYSYLKEVDYCSGASLLIPKSHWDMLSGFDERFEPAYYEDTDLCFRLRECGLKVVYQPLSIVTHTESVSYGTEENSKKHQLLDLNLKKFQIKWKEILLKSHEKYGKNVSLARDRSHRGKTILIIDHYVPESDMDGGSLSTMNIINSLIECGWSVKFWPDNLFPTYGYTSNLQQIGVEILYTPWVDDLNAWIKSNPIIDCILLSRPTVAIKHLDMINKNYPELPVMYYGHDLHHKRLYSEAAFNENTYFKKEANRIEKIEKYIWENVSCSFYPSKDEVDCVREYNNQINVRQIPLCSYREFPNVRKTPNNQSILFVGNFRHTPNVTGLIWFFDKVYPLISLAHPSAIISIVGAEAPDAIKKFSSKSNIKFYGHVSNDELTQLYDNSRCVIIPLLSGAGVKMKTVEAIWRAAPIVSTPIGTQGIENAHTFIKIAENEREFSEYVNCFLENDELCDSASKFEMSYARDYFSFSNASKTIEKELLLFMGNQN